MEKLSFHSCFWKARARVTVIHSGTTCCRRIHCLWRGFFAFYAGSYGPRNAANPFVWGTEAQIGLSFEIHLLWNGRDGAWVGLSPDMASHQRQMHEERPFVYQLSTHWHVWRNQVRRSVASLQQPAWKRLTHTHTRTHTCSMRFCTDFPALSGFATVCFTKVSWGQKNSICS